MWTALYFYYVCSSGIIERVTFNLLKSLFRLFEVPCFWILVFIQTALQIIYQAIKDFFHVRIASSMYTESRKNSRKLCKPLRILPSG